MLLIRADGTERDVEGHVTPEGIQFIVGGYVQHMHLPDGRYMFFDGSTSAGRKASNPKATRLTPEHASYVVGDVLILTREEYDHMQTIRPFKRKP